jgi:hypothetical protein
VCENEDVVKSLLIEVILAFQGNTTYLFVNNHQQKLTMTVDSINKNSSIRRLF